jgi:hypothetical protein
MTITREHAERLAGEICSTVALSEMKAFMGLDGFSIQAWVTDKLLEFAAEVQDTGRQPKRARARKER